MTLIMGTAPATDASNRRWRFSSRARVEQRLPPTGQQLLVGRDHVLAATHGRVDEVERDGSPTDDLHHDVDTRVADDLREVGNKDPWSSVRRHLALVDLEHLDHLQVDTGAVQDLIVLFLDEPVDARAYGAEAQQSYAHDPIFFHFCSPTVAGRQTGSIVQKCRGNGKQRYVITLVSTGRMRFQDE